MLHAQRRQNLKSHRRKFQSKRCAQSLLNLGHGDTFERRLTVCIEGQTGKLKRADGCLRRAPCSNQLFTLPAGNVVAGRGQYDNCAQAYSSQPGQRSSSIRGARDIGQNAPHEIDRFVTPFQIGERLSIRVKKYAVVADTDFQNVDTGNGELIQHGLLKNRPDR